MLGRKKIPPLRDRGLAETMYQLSPSLTARESTPFQTHAYVKELTG
ncbi:protein of unknown function [Candidatus Methylocalor cossyra]|uniref:Uncharacterized protein n=1 Tax=Candidatus Methylocalor cossyra TaxID=3108543 RepID=A0ABM9NE53_9GAMM